MNMMTSVMEGIYQRLKHVDNYMKKSVTERYGERKLTEAEQYNAFKNMSVDKMFETIQGMKSLKEFEDWNKWLYRMEQKEANNGL